VSQAPQPLPTPHAHAADSSHAPTDLPALLARSGLPAELAALVLDTARRTRLWRSEQLDVARELIAHFRDGLDASRTPADLRAAFGTPADAARLIRRAKRRNRPLWWHLQRRALHALAAIFAIYLGLIAWFLTGSPAVTRDYFAELTAPIRAIPEPDRAWPIYQAALADLNPAHERLTRQFADTRADWSSLLPSDPRWPELAAELRALAPALDRARDAARRPAMGFVPFPPPPSSGSAAPSAPPAPLLTLLLPHLGEARRVARFLTADALLAADQRDGPRAAANLSATLAVGRHVAEFPCLLSGLVEFAIVSLAADRTQRIIQLAPDALTTDDLIHLAHAFASVRGGGPIRIEPRELNAERAFFDDVLQRVFTDNGQGDGRLTPEGFRLLRSAQLATAELESTPTTGDILLTPAAAFFTMSRQDNARGYALALDSFQSWAAQPPWTRRTFPDPERAAGISGRALAPGLSPIALLLPAINQAATAAERTGVFRDAALTAIALELFRRREGRYPDRLDQLVPRFLPAVPIDPMDGQPLRYTLRAGQPLLYSVGHDRVDDGGKLNLTGKDQPASQWRPLDQPVDPARLGDWILHPIPREPAPN
jgi:hypothetical protein